MAKKRRVCRSKKTGKIVSCARQRAGKKAARSKGSRGLGKGKKRKTKCLKRSKRGPSGKTRCLQRAKR
jgi:hypothetical protein